MNVGVLEVLLMWIAISLYGVSTVLFTIGGIFSKDRWFTIGLYAALVGVVIQAASYGVRWADVGHLPFLGFYEAVSRLSWATIVTLLVISFVKPSLRPLAVILMPLALLGVGASMLADKGGQDAGASLSSWWLVIHVTFTNLASVCFTVAFAMAVAYLMRDRQDGGGRLKVLFERLPSQDVVDDLSYRFAAAGLILLGVMIVSGAIWANQAWGRYWAWDPVETWSLITWLGYALFVHLRLTLGWKGRKSAWMLVAVVPLLPFTLVGVPLVYDSIHGAYMRGLMP